MSASQHILCEKKVLEKSDWHGFTDNLAFTEIKYVLEISWKKMVVFAKIELYFEFN